MFLALSYPLTILVIKYENVKLYCRLRTNLYFERKFYYRKVNFKCYLTNKLLEELCDNTQIVFFFFANQIGIGCNPISSG